VGAKGIALVDLMSMTSLASSVMDDNYNFLLKYFLIRRLALVRLIKCFDVKLTRCCFHVNCLEYLTFDLELRQRVKKYMEEFKIEAPLTTKILKVFILTDGHVSKRSYCEKNYNKIKKLLR